MGRIPVLGLNADDSALRYQSDSYRFQPEPNHSKVVLFTRIGRLGRIDQRHGRELSNQMPVARPLEEFDFHVGVKCHCAMMPNGDLEGMGGLRWRQTSGQRPPRLGGRVRPMRHSRIGGRFTRRAGPMCPQQDSARDAAGRQSQPNHGCRGSRPAAQVDG